MANATSPELLHFLACPDCYGDLFEDENVLKCAGCGREYEVRCGIPLLYPEKMDLQHLREEQALAKMMKQPRLSRKDRFSSLQWEKSKREFWDMVRRHVEPPPKSFVNIGCGYDASFREFQQDGYAFVNFDLVYDMLYDLRETHGARCCVVGDLNRLPFKRHSFDYVASIDVIHHESDKLSVVLESFTTLLKPGGSLFLEDLNAWGLYQCAKSLFLPKPVHRLLRSIYHKLKGSSHKPAEYEYPTSLRRVKRILDELGFSPIVVHANSAYPNIGPLSFRIYELFSEIEWFRKYRNYHYMLSATKRLA
jgi:SAM-dependent methyltransferase